MTTRTTLTLFLLLVPTATLTAAPVEIDSGASVFAVVTHKAGLAARFAHDHFVVASGAAVDLSVDPADLEQAAFTLRVAAADLRVDEAADHRQWFPRLEALDLLDSPFAEISAKDRSKIREAMLGRSQLDAETHPEIRVELEGVEIGGASVGSLETTHRLEVALTVRGRTVRVPVSARVELDGERLVVEAAGTARFTDLGIEPFSAMLGAVRNEDAFDLYLALEGRIRSPSPE